MNTPRASQNRAAALVRRMEREERLAAETPAERAAAEQEIVDSLHALLDTLNR